MNIENVVPTAYTIQRPLWFTSQFLKANYIREVTLSLTYKSHISRELMWTFITEFPFWLEGFTALTKLIVEIPPTKAPIRTRNYKGIVRTIMKRIEKKVGVPGRITQIPNDRRIRTTGRIALGYAMLEKELWVFEAQNGVLMDWSKGAGKAYPNQVGRWSNGYWDEAFFEDNSFRLGMMGGQFVYQGMDDEFEE